MGTVTYKAQCAHVLGIPACPATLLRIVRPLTVIPGRSHGPLTRLRLLGFESIRGLRGRVTSPDLQGVGAANPSRCFLAICVECLSSFRVITSTVQEPSVEQRQLKEDHKIPRNGVCEAASPCRSCGDSER